MIAKRRGNSPQPLLVVFPETGPPTLGGPVSFASKDKSMLGIKRQGQRGVAA
jgi:hypothetical protein